MLSIISENGLSYVIFTYNHVSLHILRKFALLTDWVFIS